MAFSEDAWARCETIRAAIHEHPFNRELAAGTLPAEAFRAYMVQDALYLVAYSKALAACAVRAPDADEQVFFAGAAREAIVVERALHADYLGRFGISADDMAAAEASPTGLAYTSFLLACAQSAPYEDLVAAILPCFWIYWDVGNAIAARAGPGNPYQAWIDTYSDPEFGEAVTAARRAADRAARAAPAREEAMHAAFRRCCQFEWMFWDAAYRREDWPV